MKSLTEGLTLPNFLLGAGAAVLLAVLSPYLVAGLVKVGVIKAAA